jgi:hypothetical protein
MPLHFTHGIVRVIVGRKELIEKEYECKVKKRIDAYFDRTRGELEG